ncbi:MAG: hypothetical protein ACTSUU_06190 [Candidatus Thorarchaeota archaeon]
MTADCRLGDIGHEVCVRPTTALGMLRDDQVWSLRFHPYSSNPTIYDPTIFQRENV